MKEKIDYHFKALDNVDYEIKFTMKAKSKLVNKMFVQSVKRLRRKLDSEKSKKLKDSDPTKITRFDVEPRFFPVIATIMNRHIKSVEKQIKEDKIEILRSKVLRCEFEREKVTQDWKIKITLGGQYVDKRFR